MPSAFFHYGDTLVLLMAEISALMLYPFFFLSPFLPATKFWINTAALV
jgi:hypothetical protein